MPSFPRARSVSRVVGVVVAASLLCAVPASAELDVAAAGATLDYALQNLPKALGGDEKQNLEYAKGLVISIGGLDPTGISPALLKIILQPVDEPDPTFQKLVDLDKALSDGFGQIAVAFSRLETFVSNTANRAVMDGYRAQVETIQNDLNAYYTYKPTGAGDPQAGTLDAKLTVDKETPIQNYANFIKGYCDQKDKKDIFTETTRLQYGDIAALETEGVGLIRELEQLEKDYLQIETKLQSEKGLLTDQRVATLTNTAHSHFQPALDACKKGMVDEMRQVTSDWSAQRVRTQEFLKATISAGTSRKIVDTLAGRYPRLDWFVLQTANAVAGDADVANVGDLRMNVEPSFDGHVLVYGFAPKYVLEEYPADVWSKQCKAAFDSFLVDQVSTTAGGFGGSEFVTVSTTYYRYKYGSHPQVSIMGTDLAHKDFLGLGVVNLKRACDAVMGDAASIRQTWAARPGPAGTIDYATSNPASHAFFSRVDAGSRGIDYVVVLGEARTAVQSTVNASLRTVTASTGRTDSYYYLQNVVSSTYLDIVRPTPGAAAAAQVTISPSKTLMDVAGMNNSGSFKILSTTTGASVHLALDRNYVRTGSAEEWTFVKLTNGNYNICARGTPSRGIPAQCVSIPEGPTSGTLTAVVASLPKDVSTAAAEWRLVPQ